MEKTISIYEALRLRDKYKEDLEHLLNSSDGKRFVAVRTESSDNIDGTPINDIENTLKSNYDRSHQLIKNISELTRLINCSNAITTVTIAGVTYTVADAMAKAKNIDLEIQWYKNIATNLANANKDIIRYNQTHLNPESISSYLERMTANMPDDVKGNKELMDSYIEGWEKDYIKKNTKVLVDPYNLSSQVDSIYEEISEFQTQYNIEITKSNLQTEISVDLG